MILNNYIKFISQKDITTLQKFLSKNYSTNHILSKKKKLLEFIINIKRIINTKNDI